MRAVSEVFARVVSSCDLGPGETLLYSKVIIYLVYLPKTLITYLPAPPGLLPTTLCPTMWFHLRDGVLSNSNSTMWRLCLLSQ